MNVVFVELLLIATGANLTGVDGANAGRLDSDDGLSEKSIVGVGGRVVPPTDG